MTLDVHREPLEHLAAFAVGLTWDTMPQNVRRRAQLALLDTLGTILGGATTRAARTAARAAVAHGGHSPIIGSPGTSSTPFAAFATAVSASALDFDDGHYLGGAIHPGSVIISSLLTAAAQPDQGGDVGMAELLAAQVVGYEISLRAAHLLWPRHDTADYHCTGTAATLGAAAAVTKLRGGDADEIARSIAIAWAHAPMATFQLPMVKESIGWSAASACFAADLAAAGFMAGRVTADADTVAILPPTPFHRDGAMDDPFVASLGTVFEALNTYSKPYAACRYTHTAAGALATTMAENALTGDDIISIDVHTHRSALFLHDQRPPTLEHGQYSFPFVLSAIVCEGAAGQVEISEEALADPQRLAEAAKVRVHHQPELDGLYPHHYAARVVVRTKDGDTIDVTRIVAYGDNDDPMSAEDLDAKFIALATPSLGGDASQLAQDLVGSELTDLHGVFALLT